MIGRDRTASLAATSVLSLGLLVPFGGNLGVRAATIATTLASPPKHVTLVRDGRRESVETRALTVGELLGEQGVVANPGDALVPAAETTLDEGETVTFRSAVPLTLVVDGAEQTLRSAATSVAGVLAERGVTYDAHDRVQPAPKAALAAGATVRVTHVLTWTETVRDRVAPPTKHVLDDALGPNATKIVDPGQPGVREVTYAVNRRGAHTRLAARILRAPRTRVIARGIASYASLAQFAERGIDGTIKLANAALSMVATAYTANCSGCSGVTASGQRAGHGIVAVDPSVIPLGTRLFIPGYGRAVAGDTGGAIRGHRIDLGFNSDGDAMRFGRRPVLVYVLR